jgi:hypothetical protein
LALENKNVLRRIGEKIKLNPEKSGSKLAAKKFM